MWYQVWKMFPLEIFGLWTLLWSTSTMLGISFYASFWSFQAPELMQSPFDSTRPQKQTYFDDFLGRKYIVKRLCFISWAWNYQRSAISGPGNLQCVLCNYQSHANMHKGSHQQQKSQNWDIVPPFADPSPPCRTREAYFVKKKCLFQIYRFWNKC